MKTKSIFTGIAIIFAVNLTLFLTFSFLSKDKKNVEPTTLQEQLTKRAESILSKFLFEDNFLVLAHVTESKQTVTVEKFSKNPQKIRTTENSSSQKMSLQAARENQIITSPEFVMKKLPGFKQPIKEIKEGTESKILTEETPSKVTNDDVQRVQFSKDVIYFRDTNERKELEKHQIDSIVLDVVIDTQELAKSSYSISEIRVLLFTTLNLSLSRGDNVKIRTFDFVRKPSLSTSIMNFVSANKLLLLLIFLFIILGYLINYLFESAPLRKKETKPFSDSQATPQKMDISFEEPKKKEAPSANNLLQNARLFPSIVSKTLGDFIEDKEIKG